MAELIAQLRATELKSKAAYNRAAYDDRLSQLEQLLLSLKDQTTTLALLAFNPDLALVAGDGTKVPARKSVLVEKSPHFRRMLEDHDDSREAQSGEVHAKLGNGTGASAAALRQLMALLHGQQLKASNESSVLIEMCELATRWELDSVLESVSTMVCAKAKASATIACEVLVAVRGHAETDGPSTVWKRLLEAAAQGVAQAGPKLTDVPAFKQLDFAAICEAMAHIKSSTIVLPSFEVDTASEKWIAKQVLDGPPADEDLSWLLGAAGAKVQAKQGFSGSVCLSVASAGREVWGQGDFWVKQPASRNITKERTSSFTNVGTASALVVLPSDLPDHLSNGKFRCGGSVVVHKTQRQYELFNLWLRANGTVSEAHLAPVDALLCFRAYATGCDVDGASDDDLRAKLAQRGLSTSGERPTLELRLRDAAYAEVPAGSAAYQATKVLAQVVARHYGKASNIEDLDAASLADVLACDDLRPSSEMKILKDIMRWAQLSGRSDEVIAKVMPLVRLPLVPLVQLQPPLKALMKRCPVVKELVEEAIGLQLRPALVSGFTPKRHRLMDGSEDTEVPRHKKRKHCSGDKVQPIDARAFVAAIM